MLLCVGAVRACVRSRFFAVREGTPLLSSLFVAGSAFVAACTGWMLPAARLTNVSVGADGAKITLLPPIEESANVIALRALALWVDVLISDTSLLREVFGVEVMVT